MSCSEVEGEDSYCYVYIMEDNTMKKGCLEYGAENPDIMTSVWPEGMKCITVLDGESKGTHARKLDADISLSSPVPGVPNGHGCKCLAQNCNLDLCSAANTHDPPHEDIEEDREEVILQEGKMSIRVLQRKFRLVS